MRVRAVILGLVGVLLALAIWFRWGGHARTVSRPASSGPKVSVVERTSKSNPRGEVSAEPVVQGRAEPRAGSSRAAVNVGQLPPAQVAIPSRKTDLARTLPDAHPVVPLSPTVPEGQAEVSPEEVALDVDKITLSLRDYRTVMRENPVGTNAEITHALDGGNPRQARLLPAGQPINASGEMIDRWGTPYFFHQLSRDHMEVRSAGPDKTMWTTDDTVSN